MVRLWVDGEDFGTMTEAAANAFIEQNRARYPAEVCRVDEVADDAPTFLESGSELRNDETEV